MNAIVTLSMKERCICPVCGRGHTARKAVDTVARAKAGAAARWSSPAEKLEAAKEALASAPTPKVARTVKSIPAGTVEAEYARLGAYVAREHPAAAKGRDDMDKDFARTTEAFDYKCTRHRLPQKGCWMCPK